MGFLEWFLAHGPAAISLVVELVQAIKSIFESDADTPEKIAEIGYRAFTSVSALAADNPQWTDADKLAKYSDFASRMAQVLGFALDSTDEQALQHAYATNVARVKSGQPPAKVLPATR